MKGDRRSDGIEVRRSGRDGCVVRLRGEFDILRLPELAAALGVALAWGRETVVNLSGVTFLDPSCVRELALLGGLHADRVVFREPSREAEASVAAWGMEEFVLFHRVYSRCRRSRRRKRRLGTGGRCVPAVGR